MTRTPDSMIQTSSSRWLIRSTIVAIMALAGCLMSPGMAKAGPMSQYADRYRPLIVFAPSSDGAALIKQRALLDASMPGLIERDMVIIIVTGEQADSLSGPAPRASAQAFRSAYNVSAEQFRVVLVGKDGGVKQTWRQPVAPASVFALIDAMPMRRDEMRRRARG